MLLLFNTKDSFFIMNIRYSIRNVLYEISKACEKTTYFIQLYLNSSVLSVS